MQDTRNKVDLGALNGAVVDLVALINQSPLSGRLLNEAKMSIDPALLRILAGINRFGPIGIVELADRAGRDHTTVSRQVAKLEDLGLVERRVSLQDRRISEALLSAKGRRIAEKLMVAQAKVVAPIIAKWSARDLNELTRLMAMLVEDLSALKDVEAELVAL